MVLAGSNDKLCMLWMNPDLGGSKFGHLNGGVYSTLARLCSLLQDQVVGDYVDGFYNSHRRHSSIGHVIPIEKALRLISAGKAARLNWPVRPASPGAKT